MAENQMDFATAFGKLCDRYGVRVLPGDGTLAGNMVIVEREGDTPTKYVTKRHIDFFALECVDESRG